MFRELIIAASCCYMTLCQSDIGSDVSFTVALGCPTRSLKAEAHILRLLGVSSPFNLLILYSLVADMGMFPTRFSKA